MRDSSAANGMKVEDMAGSTDHTSNEYEPTTEEILALVQAKQLNYEAVFDTIKSDLPADGANIEIDLHYLRFNANGLPKLRELVDVLANHLVNYAIDATRTEDATTGPDWGKLFWEAKELLRKYEASGDAGELLLYFLMECALGAPQMVAKISLKTNPNVEVHGSDGIHARWNKDRKEVELFFGEAKIYGDLGAALDSAISSIGKFYQEGLENEIRILTTKYKHADGPLKDYVISYAQGTEVGGSASLNHAVLLGYDWDEYKRLEELPAEERETAFRRAYTEDDGRLWGLLEGRLKKLHIDHVRMHVFFLPFRSVDEFRKAFHSKVIGG